MLVLVLPICESVVLILGGRLAGIITMLLPVLSIIAQALVGSTLNEPRRGPRLDLAGAPGILKGSGAADGEDGVVGSSKDNDGWRRSDCGRVVGGFGSSSVVSP